MYISVCVCLCEEVYGYICLLFRVATPEHSITLSIHKIVGIKQKCLMNIQAYVHRRRVNDNTMSRSLRRSKFVLDHSFGIE